MQLSHESYRTRWLILVTAWTIAAYFLLQQASIIRDYLAIVGNLGLRGAPVATTPLKQAFPSFAADAEVWVRHALSLLEGDDLRLRYTTIDNAPAGREVHWNSAWAWTIALAGKVHHLFSGKPITYSVEQAAIWLSPIALFCLVVVLSSWATRRLGAIAGVFLVAAMVGNDRIFEGFFPSYVDHHGLLTVSVLAMVLGAAAMGGGWWQPKTAGDSSVLPTSDAAIRSGAIFSALAGACGLWVSAASVIPAIAIVGLSGVIAILLQGRYAQNHGAKFEGGAWRLWGRVGAAASFGFYLLEYFPNHLSLHLEPNHPFHSLAWLGGGELIAQFGERWLGSPEKRWTGLRSLIWPVAAAALTPVTILLGGLRVFSLFDPFMSRLHNDYIQEFLPLWRTLRGFDSKMVFQILVVDSSPLIAAIATLSFRRRETPIVLWFIAAAALMLNTMAWMQSRWLLNSSGAQVVLALVLVACWTASLRTWIRWSAALLIIGITFVPTGVMRQVGAKAEVAARRVAPRDANSSLARDIANTLRASQPTGDIVMLASPNASTQIGYYGRFKTLGTLYWENAVGLKSAAAILSAHTDEEAAALIRKHQVTHIALLKEENFIKEYYQLLNPKAMEEDVKRSFGYRIFVDKAVPQWLQMIPYRVPDDMKALNPVVMLFKVNFTQNLAEAYYNVALAQIAQEAYVDAERTLDVLLRDAPHNYQPWMRKGDVLLARHEWEAAVQNFLKGISLAPQAERPALYIETAGTLYHRGQHGYAVRIYAQALSERRTPEVVYYLAWLLATSRFDNVRDGKIALELAQEGVRADSTSPTAWNSLAAALAENNRFPEAIEACDRAIANARVRGETSAVQTFEQRLAVLRSGKPLRN